MYLIYSGTQSARELKLNVPHQQTRPFTCSGMCNTGASLVMAGTDFMRRLVIEESKVTQCMALSLTKNSLRF